MKKWMIGLVLAGSITAAGTAGAAEEGENSSNPTSLSYKEKKELLTEAALEHNIPPEIVKAIAYEETGMRQFNESGDSVMNQNEDGGVGIMQVTLDENDLENRNVDRQRLKNDTAYNIEIGVDLLNEKWSWSGSVLPTVNSGDKQVLENWYFACHSCLQRSRPPQRSG
ncbi:transglycosylase SLT domain-containing protein [Salibacterium halotolerans]|uniref:Transglycosylase SLT domain-containing protein n=1 Tax=Salibacterium halotolerans TaxID=1884432 RepID=A0A1I5WW18_9BACI|nr:transglycosylase SLT domain-containing protein [Salibacterium halotolerans]SFQ23894.1 Transglycosylase SLT domain-containing protein [Salibacterium halotolerans]